MLGPLIALVLATPLPSAPPPPTPIASPATACASNTGKAISGTVAGQDGLDVNVSIGFDVVDSAGRAVNVDPTKPGYGCAKTGGYSLPQTYLNHFVSPTGAPRDSLMQDGNRTRRDWRVGNLPSNAVGAYIEVYHRGYTGSPCRDSAGNYCFNPPTLTKYGYSNKHIVPVGTANLPIVLPTTCGYGGTAGSLTGTVTVGGKPAALRNLYAWTEAKWNAAPGVHGWGSGKGGAGGSYTVPALASRQTYVVWATTTSGVTIKRFGVRVDDCKATRLDISG